MPKHPGDAHWGAHGSPRKFHGSSTEVPRKFHGSFWDFGWHCQWNVGRTIFFVVFHIFLNFFGILCLSHLFGWNHSMVDVFATFSGFIMLLMHFILGNTFCSSFGSRDLSQSSNSNSEHGWGTSLENCWRGSRKQAVAPYSRSRKQASKQGYLGSHQQASKQAGIPFSSSSRQATKQAVHYLWCVYRYLFWLCWKCFGVILEPLGAVWGGRGVRGLLDQACSWTRLGRFATWSILDYMRSHYENKSGGLLVCCSQVIIFQLFV